MLFQSISHVFHAQPMNHLPDKKASSQPLHAQDTCQSDAELTLIELTLIELTLMLITLTLMVSLNYSALRCCTYTYIASFPSPARFSILQATESWVGPGNEANAYIHQGHLALCR